MAGARLDADQHRRVARLHFLERGGELEAVAGHHAVVVVGGGDEGGRVVGAGLEVVQRGVGVERFEHLRIIGGAIVRCPRPSDSEFVKAEHVHHANGWQCCAKQIRALRHAGPHQQAPVAATANGEL